MSHFLLLLLPFQSSLAWDYIIMSRRHFRFVQDLDRVSLQDLQERSNGYGVILADMSEQQQMPMYSPYVFPELPKLIYTLPPANFANYQENVQWSIERISECTASRTIGFQGGSVNARILYEPLVKEVLLPEEQIDLRTKVNIERFHLDVCDIVAEKAKYEESTDVGTTVEGCSIVANREILALLASSIQRQQTYIKVKCCFYKGRLFLKKGREPMPDYQNGDKIPDADINRPLVFECAMTCPQENEPNFLTAEAPWYQLYVQTMVTLNNKQIFVNGEVNCLDWNNKLEQVDLKCRKGGLASEPMWNFYSAEWFMRSKLVGTEKLLVGKYYDGIDKVEGVEAINISELETGSGHFRDGRCFSFQNPWKKSALFKHLNDVLDTLYQVASSPEYYGKVVEVVKEAGEKGFFVTYVTDDLKAIFPDHFLTRFGRYNFD